MIRANMLSLTISLLLFQGPAVSVQAPELKPPTRDAAPIPPADIATVRAGDAAYQQGRLDEAIARYEEVLKANSENAFAMNQLADAYFQRKEYQKALDVAARGIERCPSRPYRGSSRASNARVNRPQVDRCISAMRSREPRRRPASSLPAHDTARPSSAITTRETVSEHITRQPLSPDDDDQLLSGLMAVATIRCELVRRRAYWHNARTGQRARWGDVADAWFNACPEGTADSVAELCGAACRD